MKNLLLLFVSFVFFFLYSVNKLDGKDTTMLQELDKQMEAIDYTSSDVLYDDDAITLMDTYSFQNDDFISFQLNQVSRELRTLTSRIQIRYQILTSLVKRLTQLLSNHLTNLVTHFSSSHSTMRPLCWQYAADCYVFAFRQIII